MSTTLYAWFPLSNIESVCIKDYWWTSNFSVFTLVSAKFVYNNDISVVANPSKEHLEFTNAIAYMLEVMGRVVYELPLYKFYNNDLRRKYIHSQEVINHDFFKLKPLLALNLSFKQQLLCNCIWYQDDTIYIVQLGPCQSRCTLSGSDVRDLKSKNQPMKYCCRSCGGSQRRKWLSWERGWRQVRKVRIQGF